MEDLSNHQVISDFLQGLANGQDFADKANALMAELKILLSCIGYLLALLEGKSQEEAKKAGHAYRSAFYAAMRAIQESPAAEGILHPTLQSTVDECTAAMENCTTTQDEIATKIQELVAKVHELLPVHLKAQEAMCTVTKDMYDIVHEYKELLPELLLKLSSDPSSEVSSETLEKSKAEFALFSIEVERCMSLAEPIYAAVCEDVQRWKNENPL